MFVRAERQFTTENTESTERKRAGKEGEIEQIGRVKKKFGKWSVIPFWASRRAHKRGHSGKGWGGEWGVARASKSSMHDFDGTTSMPPAVQLYDAG